MRRNTAAQARRRKLLSALLLILVLSSVTVFAMSFLPWFEYLRGDDRKNPYDLVALDSMDPTQREKIVDGWVQEWRTLNEPQRAEKADHFLDAVVVLMEEKLDLDKRQSVETKSLVKGTAMIASQAGLRQGPESRMGRANRDPERRQKMRELAEKVRGQMEQILTPSQREQFQQLMRERDQRMRERQFRDPDDEWETEGETGGD
jgi:hypothetical protein